MQEVVVPALLPWPVVALKQALVVALALVVVVLVVLVLALVVVVLVLALVVALVVVVQPCPVAQAGLLVAAACEAHWRCLQKATMWTHAWVAWKPRASALCSRLALTTLTWPRW